MTLQHGNGLPQGARRQGKEKAGNQQSRTGRAERRNVHDAVHLTFFWTICKRARPSSVTVRSPMSAAIRSAEKVPSGIDPVTGPSLWAVRLARSICTSRVFRAYPPAARTATGPSTSTVSRSEEHTSELQSLMRISSAVFCLKKKTTTQQQ